MLGNAKALKRPVRECKGILIGPSMAPRFSRRLSFLRYVFVAAQKATSASGQILRHGWQADNHLCVAVWQYCRQLSRAREALVFSVESTSALCVKKILRDCDAEFVEFVETMGLFLRSWEYKLECDYLLWPTSIVSVS
jgi:hypothetical protein